MSGRGRGARGRQRQGQSFRSRGGDQNAIKVARSRQNANYRITDDKSRSLSEFSSLTDVSTTELSSVEVDLQSSLLKV